MDRIGTIHYLSGRDVEDLLPPLDELIDLAGVAFTALAGDDVEMPPKVGVHAGPGEFIHAMPAWFRSSGAVGLKWVAGFPGNGPKGLRGVTGLIMMNDPGTGYTTCIMDGTLITLQRTVAVTGLALRLYRPSEVRRLAIIGCGAQGHAHLPALLAGLASVEVLAYDNRLSCAESLVQAARGLPGVESAAVARDVASAVDGADVIFSATGAPGAGDELVRPPMVGMGTLLLPVDWAQTVTAETARAAAWFVVDDRAQFEYIRGLGGEENFPGYPDPHETLGERLARGGPAQGTPPGPVVVSNLGIAAVDILIANDVLHRAERDDAGIRLEW